MECLLAMCTGKWSALHIMNHQAPRKFGEMSAHQLEMLMMSELKLREINNVMSAVRVLRFVTLGPPLLVPWPVKVISEKSHSHGPPSTIVPSPPIRIPFAIESPLCNTTVYLPRRASFWIVHRDPIYAQKLPESRPVANADALSPCTVRG